MVDVSYSPSPDSSSKETHYLDDQSKLKLFMFEWEWEIRHFVYLSKPKELEKKSMSLDKATNPFLISKTNFTIV